MVCLPDRADTQPADMAADVQEFHILLEWVKRCFIAAVTQSCTNIMKGKLQISKTLEGEMGEWHGPYWYYPLCFSRARESCSIATFQNKVCQQPAYFAWMAWQKLPYHRLTLSPIKSFARCKTTAVALRQLETENSSSHFSFSLYWSLSFPICFSSDEEIIKDMPRDEYFLFKCSR